MKYPIEVKINGELVLYGDFTDAKLNEIRQALLSLGLKDAFDE